MTTKKKKKGVAGSDGTAANPVTSGPATRRNQNAAEKPEQANETPTVLIELDKIDYSPLNHRKHINQRKLEELSDSIAKLGVIEEITVRVTLTGRYELAVGERRVRAAIMAGIKWIPAKVRELTDDQVVERQLAENFERQDPHFMEEAYGISILLKMKKSIQEVAARMGRTDKYVYTRVKLLDLIDSIQEMAMADCFTLTQSVGIAALSHTSQEDFYQSHCHSWKETEQFKVPRLDYLLSTYHCRLATAPFNINDDTLVPGMGVCPACLYNTACVTSMFPEDEKNAKCANRTCFEEKTQLSFLKGFADFITANNVTALIYRGEADDLETRAVEYAASIRSLETIEFSSITEMSLPKEPTVEQFTEGYAGEEEDDDEFVEEEEEYREFDEEEEENDDYQIDSEFEEDDERDCQRETPEEPETSENSTSVPIDSSNELTPDETSAPVFDQEGYEEAMEEYQEQLADHQRVIAEYPLFVGVSIGYNQQLRVVHFIRRPREKNALENSRMERPTSKQVYDALKAGTATADMLDGEIRRSQEWIARKEQIDKEKVQLSVYDTFRNLVKDSAKSTTQTAADIVGRRWLMYQGLSYSDKSLADAILFSHRHEKNEKVTIDDFNGLTDDEEGVLIKIAVMGRDITKRPGDVAAEVLYNMAQPWINVSEIETKQASIAEKRRNNQQDKASKLQLKIAELDPNRPKSLPAWATSLAVSDCDELEAFIQKYLSPEPLSDNQEEAKERALYAAREEVKTSGFASIEPAKSVTGKMVVYIPQAA